MENNKVLDNNPCVSQYHNSSSLNTILDNFILQKNSLCLFIIVISQYIAFQPFTFNCLLGWHIHILPLSSKIIIRILSYWISFGCQQTKRAWESYFIKINSLQDVLKIQQELIRSYHANSTLSPANCCLVASRGC